MRRRALLGDGLEVRVKVNEAATIAVAHDSNALDTRPGQGGATPRPRRAVLDRAKATVERGGGTARLRLRPGRRARRALADHPGPVRSRLLVSVTDGAGNERVLTAKVRIG